MHDTLKLAAKPVVTDDEILAVIRAQRQAGGRVTFTWLRETVGGLGTKRLQRLLKQEADAHAPPVATAPSTAVAVDPLAADIHQRASTMEKDFALRLGRLLAGERSSSAHILAAAQADAQAQLDQAAARHRMTEDEMAVLGNLLDETDARVDRLTLVVDALQRQLSEERARIAVLRDEQQQSLDSAISAHAAAEGARTLAAAQGARADELARDLASTRDASTRLRHDLQETTDRLHATEQQLVAKTRDIERWRGAAMRPRTRARKPRIESDKSRDPRT